VEDNIQAMIQITFLVQLMTMKKILLVAGRGWQVLDFMMMRRLGSINVEQH